MSKNNTVRESFKIQIQRAKIERQRRQRLANVELDDTLDHHVWNGLDTVQYKVILGDSSNIANLVPKKEYSLVITDIHHGYNIRNFTYGCEPYTYKSFNKVVSGFLDVTTSPLWRFLVFHSYVQGGAVLTTFKDKENSRKQLYWHKPSIRSSNTDSFKSDTENIHLACWTKYETYETILINEKSEGKYSQALSYNVVVNKLTYEEIDLKGGTVNIYQKPQALINYLINTFSREGDWVLDLFSGSGTTIACSLPKGRNYISIENDLLQCNYIKQRINAMKFLPDEMQEDGLKKGEFSESLVAKMSKEPQPHLKGMFGKDHFGHFAEVEDPMEEHIEVQEESQPAKNVNFDEDFGMHDIVD